MRAPASIWPKVSSMARLATVRSIPARLRRELHAQLSALAEGGLAPRDRPGHPRIVQRPLGLETRHGRVDLVGLVLAPGQALANLRLGQLAGGEHV